MTSFSKSRLPLAFLFFVSVISAPLEAQTQLLPGAAAAEKKTKDSPTPEPNPQEALPGIQGVKERRGRIQAVLKSLQKDPVLYKDQIRLLSDLDSALARQEETLTVRSYLENEKNALSRISRLPMEAQINEKFSRPYNLGKLDSLYEERENLEEETRLSLDASVQSDELLTQDLKAFEKSEESRRLAKDQPEDLSVSTSSADLQSRVDLAKLLRSKVNAANTKIKKENLELRKKILEPQILFVQKNLQVDETIWHETKRLYDTKELAIKESLKKAQENLAASQKDLEKMGTLPPAASPAEKAKMEALQIANLAAQIRSTLNEAWQEQIRQTGEIMRHRFDLYGNKARPADKRTWDQKMEETLGRLEPQSDYLATQLESAQKKLEALKSKSRESTDKEVLLWTETAIRHQSDLITCYQEQIWSTKSIIQLCKRLQSELNAGRKTFSWAEMQDHCGNYLKTLWLKELFQMEDRAFRVSTLFWVLFWLGVGLLVAWSSSALLGKKILLRYGFATGAASAYQKLVYYGILVMFCVGIFEYFNFSLTSLTIISGALALGVGFGSQEIIKNFISGLILLFERPVNEGDIIQLDGDPVKVERIGARSTQVKAGDNTQRILPNSYLLENVIINWTLSDSVIRSSILVGVAYGSNTRDVSGILLQAIRSIETVHPEPEPEVQFSDFGDNALIFKVLFSSATDQRVDICSEARHRIYEALDKAGISMPFPQRDIHLDSSKPLEFRMLSEIKAPSDTPADRPEIK